MVPSWQGLGGVPAWAGGISRRQVELAAEQVREQRRREEREIADLAAAVSVPDREAEVEGIGAVAKEMEGAMRGADGEIRDMAYVIGRDGPGPSASPAAPRRPVMPAYSEMTGGSRVQVRTPIVEMLKSYFWAPTALPRAGDAMGAAFGNAQVDTMNREGAVRRAEQAARERGVPVPSLPNQRIPQFDDLVRQEMPRLLVGGAPMPLREDARTPSMEGIPGRTPEERTSLAAPPSMKEGNAALAVAMGLPMGTGFMGSLMGSRAGDDEIDAALAAIPDDGGAPVDELEGFIGPIESRLFGPEEVMPAGVETSGFDSGENIEFAAARRAGPEALDRYLRENIEDGEGVIDLGDETAAEIARLAATLDGTPRPIISGRGANGESVAVQPGPRSAGGGLFLMDDATVTLPTRSAPGTAAPSAPPPQRETLDPVEGVPGSGGQAVERVPGLRMRDVPERERIQLEIEGIANDIAQATRPRLSDRGPRLGESMGEFRGRMAAQQQSQALAVGALQGRRAELEERIGRLDAMDEAERDRASLQERERIRAGADVDAANAGAGGSGSAGAFGEESRQFATESARALLSSLGIEGVAPESVITQTGRGVYQVNARQVEAILKAKDPAVSEADVIGFQYKVLSDVLRSLKDSVSEGAEAEADILREELRALSERYRRLARQPGGGAASAPAEMDEDDPAFLDDPIIE